MRTIETHKTNAVNEAIVIHVTDSPGDGGANHEYLAAMPRMAFGIRFQKGPLKENEPNGLTHEALLAILIDRLEAFQAGPFKNPYNQTALEHLRGALAALKARTTERVERGVEGTSNV